MSRIPSNSSQNGSGSGPSKLKISAPQPYQPPQRSYGANGSTGGYNAPSGDEARLRNPSGDAPARGSPMRPARSIRRAPNPPGAGEGYQEDASRLAPRTYRQTSVDDGIPSSPMDVVSPALGTEGGAFAWDTERTQRMKMMEVQREKEGQEGKLRNVVDMFARSSEKREVKEERRVKQTREGREEELLIGNGNGEFGDVDSVLRKIQRDWPFVLDPEFAPTSLALSLLSSSSTQTSHPPLREFLTLHSTLSTALQRSVQRHYETYASSLPEHARLSEALGRAQGLVKDTKKLLVVSRGLLGGDGDGGGSKMEMGLTWGRERVVRDMLKMLDVIEYLKQVPDKLESMIGDKRFLQASHVLMRSLKTANKEDMKDVGALTDLRTYLTDQRQALADVLIEELHNHLYLKTIYCDSRWVPYQHGQTEIITPKYDSEVDRTESFENASQQRKPTSRLSRYLYQLSTKPSRDPMLDITDEELMALPATSVATHRRGGSSHGINGAASIGSLSGVAASQPDNLKAQPFSVEADSFGYMEMLLESLAALGKLSYGIEIVAQRIGGELHAMVETVIDEVEERRDLRQMESQYKKGRPQSAILMAYGAEVINGESRPLNMLMDPSDDINIMDTAVLLAGLESAGSLTDAETLRDLFWTVYAKLHAVIEGHRVVFEVVNRISSRREYAVINSKPATLYALPIAEVWKPIQTEVRSLLLAYLTDQEQGSSVTRTPIASIAEVLREGRLVRDRQKIVFKFSNTDNKLISKDLSVFDEELNSSLKVSLPGLVLNTSGELSTLGAAGRSTGGEERLNSTEKHRLLVHANPFNVCVIFRPYIAFVTTVKDAIPASFIEEPESFGTFLDDFIAKVYLPRLEEKGTSLFQVAVSGADAFEIDRTSGRLSPYPVVKSSTQVMTIINSFCVMLTATPFNKEDYSRLIIGVIIRYYQRCNACYRDLVLSSNKREGSLLSLSTNWAQREEIVACLEALLKRDPHDPAPLSEMHAHETRLEMSLLENKIVTKDDLIKSNKHFQALAHLSYSMRWVVSQLTKLKEVSDDMLSPSMDRYRRESLYDPLEDRPVPALTLSTAMSQRLDALLSTYTQLADTLLFTIRIEIRTRAMAYLYASLHKGNYRIDADSFEPDPYVRDWTLDLSDCNAAASIAMPDEHRKFVFSGLGDLVSHLLITCGRSIRYATSHGARKIQRNIIAIQQALRNVVDCPEDADLWKAREYWSMYEMGPKAMLESIQTSRPIFSFDDYNHMLNLQCRVDPRASARLSGQAGGAQTRLSNGTGASSLNFEREKVDPERDAYNGYLIELHSLAMGVEGFE